MQPPTVAHTDWSVSTRKRWVATAQLRNGVYCLKTVEPFTDSPLLEQRGQLVLGVDFPLGLPLAYAQAIGVASFKAFMASVWRREREPFFEVADSAENISLQRPFYPLKPGGTNQQQLLDGLGFENKLSLYRWCDRATSTRRAGANMFWTMGANQIGKGMLSGWRDLVLPNWKRVALWPFDGTLDVLLSQSKLILIEAYPGEFYHHLGMFTRRGSKRSQAVRQREGEKLLRWGAENEVAFSAEMMHQISTGFGTKPDGEDPFDAVVGLCGMLNVIVGNRDEMPQLPHAIKEIEGWVFGQTDLPTTR